MDNNIDEQPSSSSGDQETPKHRFDQSLSLIAEGINVLAAKSQKPEAEKSWDKAERDRKRLHDDRTFARQGWAITVAGIAVAFNFIALVGLGVQSWNAHNAVQIAERTLEMNSRPSIAFSNFKVTQNDKSVDMSFISENKSSAAVYIYANPILISASDNEMSLTSEIKKSAKSLTIAQLFPMTGDTTHKTVETFFSLGSSNKDTKIYVTFAILASSFSGGRYVISECIVFDWNGSKFITDGKLCAHNQRYERLEDYLSGKQNAI
ncbi:hypothetical protein [Gluconobacter japonicus]|uniref:hypothetical protein n=1 Tax=Gluconobacter japonicus TaxID=376620 RepID=UPI00078502E9|nr:hypothetical protein [Gluconobacter japonicus]KXV20618.1 hypothetical protein AD935_11060 [Gluconobacter japonicus]